MALSWNEIKDRAVKFSKEWKDTTNEEADAKPFLDAFFDVFVHQQRQGEMYPALPFRNNNYPADHSDCESPAPSVQAVTECNGSAALVQ